MKEKIIEFFCGQSGEKIAGYLMSALVIAGLVYVFWMDSNYDIRCVGESKVVEILELKYRDADILLENGMVVEVSQARIKVGDPYCYDYKEFKIEDE